MSTLLDITPEPVPLSLNADQKAVGVKAFHDLARIATSLAKQTSDGTLEEDFARKMLEYLESLVARAAEALDLPAESREVIEERYANLRQLNSRIHELETQLTDAAAATDMSYAAKNLADRARHWWRTLGLGYLSEFRIRENGECELELSGHFSGNALLSFGLSHAPVTEVEELNRFLNSWAARGLEMKPEKNNTPTVLFSGKNLEVLGKFITEHLPSGVILETQAYHSRGVHSLRSMTVRVSAADLAKLAKSAD